MTDKEILSETKRFIADGIRVAQRDQQPPANTVFDAEAAKQKEKYYWEIMNYIWSCEEDREEN